MEVILLTKVKGLGALGEKVRVRAGYGRNFLVPYGKAVPATANNLAEFDKKRSEYEAKANQSLAAAESRKTQLEGATVTVKANASPEGKLFGSVGPRDIAEAFTAAGIPLTKSEVVMGEGPIRHTGEFEVTVSLHAEVQTKVKITVAAEA
jgi:large subunit ribosomal protein L9